VGDAVGAEKRTYASDASALRDPIEVVGCANATWRSLPAEHDVEILRRKKSAPQDDKGESGVIGEGTSGA
jgi:hypothetical protein